MSPLVVRRISLTAVLVVVSLLALLAWRVLGAALRPNAFYSGLLLLVVVLALTLFNARKKLPFLPLLKAAMWLQFHIYAGWFALVLFLLHIHWRVPNGALELALGIVFCIVIASGAFGLYISRALPARMTRSGEPLLYERIPSFRARIQREVEDLVRTAERETESSTLSEFYVKYLRSFFTSRPAALSALWGTERKWHALLAETSGLDRYLNEREKAITVKIRDWIETKQNLDYQESAQRLLRLWLFVHIPFTYSLVLLALAHAVVAIVYSGRW